MGRAVAATNDLEPRAEWARYFCVMASGLLENALPILYGDYVTRCANARVARYANHQLGDIQNPKMNRFLEVARAFDQSWAIDLEAFALRDGGKEAIDGIMNIRHAVAHGKSTGITIAQITNYLEKAEAVLEFIENQLNVS